MPDQQPGEWSGHARWVIQKLTEHDNRFNKYDEELRKLEIEVAKLVVKTGIYAALIGAAAAFLARFIHVGGI